MREYFVVNKRTGKIINCATSPSKQEAEGYFDTDKYELKTEEELPLSVLQKYKYWNERP